MPTTLAATNTNLKADDGSCTHILPIISVSTCEQNCCSLSSPGQGWRHFIWNCLTQSPVQQEATLRCWLEHGYQKHTHTTCTTWAAQGTKVHASCKCVAYAAHVAICLTRQSRTSREVEGCHGSPDADFSGHDSKVWSVSRWLSFWSLQSFPGVFQRSHSSHLQTDTANG